MGEMCAFLSSTENMLLRSFRLVRTHLVVEDLQHDLLVNLIETDRTFDSSATSRHNVVVCDDCLEYMMSQVATAK